MSSSNEPLIPPLAKSRTSLLPTRKPICLILSLASLLSLATFIAIQKPTIHHYSSSLRPSDLCGRAADPAACGAIVSDAIATLRPARPDPIQVLQAIIARSLLQLDTNIHRQSDVDLDPKSALADCAGLLDLSRDRLLDSASAVASGSYVDARTWLSAVLTNHDTCIDGLLLAASSSSSLKLKANLDSLVALASASLAVLNTIPPYDVKEVVNNFPSWLSVGDRKLLEAAVAANVTVAADGSGDYDTVQEAVDNAPSKGKSRYVIYVKNGTYEENVMVWKNKTNLMIVGDGGGSTVITGDRNVVDGWTTFNSATLAVVADGFILQDICIQNTAGPEKHQAVALRVGGDRSVVNRCQLHGYQDTLYAHSLRQFYRGSTVSGTVDFVFGNAAVVLQECDLVARLPMSKQKNLVTAQGRTDPNQNTGTSIQSCRVVPGPDLVPPAREAVPTYLGRPWKNFSRTVYMESYIDGHVDPKGWLEWDGGFALDTLYYGEFANVGPGAGLAGRVNWTGYNVITDPDVASRFTVAQLIQGGTWLQSTGVEYTEGLYL
ncbi:putative pectinesterase [Iris pallida]|uniref:Pectinesterase n=1 Tax=Iris pallida TaxID=29817 RepID=A0AAX6IM00_IRIPA|nr:putative pectinesterase [Iris pallida]